VHEAGDERAADVHREVARAQRHERNGPDEPQHERREQRPAVPHHHLVEHDARQRVTVRDHADPDLEPGHGAEQRPERDDQEAEVAAAE
jgi:hypothetical protein